MGRFGLSSRGAQTPKFEEFSHASDGFSSGRRAGDPGIDRL